MKAINIIQKGRRKYYWNSSLLQLIETHIFLELVAFKKSKAP